MKIIPFTFFCGHGKGEVQPHKTAAQQVFKCLTMTLGLKECWQSTNSQQSTILRRPIDPPPPQGGFAILLEAG